MNKKELLKAVVQKGKLRPGQGCRVVNDQNNQSGPLPDQPDIQTGSQRR